MAAQPSRARKLAAGANRDVAEPAASDLLDRRYRLHSQIAGSITRWSAVDELLDRPVEVRIADSGTPVDAALETSALQVDGRWLRLLDAGTSGGYSWLVIEDPCLPNLSQRLQAARLEPAETIRLGTEVAAVLASVPATAVVRLTPERVYAGPETVRIDGVAAEPAESIAAAIYDVGAIMFSALTGSWPGHTRVGDIPPAGVTAVSPRRLRGGVSRRLDAIVADALTGAIGTLEELIARLESLPKRTEGPAGPSPAIVRAKWSAARFLPPIAIAILGLLAWSIGKDLGQIPAADLPKAPASAPPVRAAHSGRLVWATPPQIASFDPQGDGSEDPTGARFAVDGNPATSWSTDLYRTAEFGGLKSGVGLVIDLGAPKAIGRAIITMSVKGSSLQLRAGNRPPTAANSLPVVAETAQAGTRVALELRRPTTARYWLIWLTRLPAVPGGFQEGIDEIRLLRPTQHSDHRP